MEAVIFVGLQASGKSTYYNVHYKMTHMHINMDTLKSRSKETKLINECLDKCYDFVIDNTNPSVESRKGYIEAAKSKGFKIKAIYFDIPFDVCKEQNSKRKAKVPPVALYTTRKKLIKPSLSEGFDDILTITKENFLCD